MKRKDEKFSLQYIVRVNSFEEKEQALNTIKTK